MAFDLLRLPSEILVEILDHLLAFDLVSLRLVGSCSDFRGVQTYERRFVDSSMK